MAKNTSGSINWKQVMERARRSDNQALYGNSSGSKAVEPYSPQPQAQTPPSGGFDWQEIMRSARAMDGQGTNVATGQNVQRSSSSAPSGHLPLKGKAIPAQRRSRHIHFSFLI